jgi:hypothetical protein
MCDRCWNKQEKQGSCAISLAESGIHCRFLLGLRESHKSTHRNKEKGGVDLNTGFLREEMRAHRKAANKITLEDLQKVVTKPRAIGHLKPNMDRIHNESKSERK